jgi:uncharacterized protein with PQ loop repeat
MGILKNKRGQTLNIISATIIGFVVLIFLIFAVLFGISALNPSSFFTAGSTEAIAVGNLTTNLTKGVGDFGTYIPTIMKVLAIVLVLSAIVLLIFYVRRMQGAGGGSAGL